MMKRSGFHEWLFQRLSTIVIAVYTIVYIGLVLSMHSYDYSHWLAMHNADWFKVYSTISLIIVMLNSILAGWQIGTDYVQKVPLACFGIIFHSFYSVVTFSMFVFGLYILWLR